MATEKDPKHVADSTTSSTQKGATLERDCAHSTSGIVQQIRHERSPTLAAAWLEHQRGLKERGKKLQTPARPPSSNEQELRSIDTFIDDFADNPDSQKLLDEAMDNIRYRTDRLEYTKHEITSWYIKSLGGIGMRRRSEQVRKLSNQLAAVNSAIGTIRKIRSLSMTPEEHGQLRDMIIWLGDILREVPPAANTGSVLYLSGRIERLCERVAQRGTPWEPARTARGTIASRVYWL